MGDYSRRDVTTNYEVSKEVRNTIKQPGAVKRLSVAVTVDDSLVAEDVDTVQSLVEAAVGLDLVRGDLVTVQQLAFNNDALAQEKALMAEMERRDLYMRIGTIAAVLLGLLAVLFVVRKIFGDMQRQMMPYILDQPMPAALPGGQMAGNLQQATNAYLSAEEMVEPPQLAAPDQTEMRLRALARHNPDVVAGIIREWVDGEKKSPMP
jgi:flagellar M-ring protein FliF